MANIQISPQALEDVKEHVAYLEEAGSPDSADRFKKEVVRQIGYLREFPDIGTPLKAVADVVLDYRFLIAGKHLIFYRSSGESVYVVRVLDGRSDYVKTLVGEPIDL